LRPGMRVALWDCEGRALGGEGRALGIARVASWERLLGVGGVAPWDEGRALGLRGLRPGR
jgi:hypothetical protein